TGSENRWRYTGGSGVGLTIVTRLPRAASHAPSAASEPAPSPSALTCVVSTMLRADSSAARTAASAGRRDSGTAIMSNTSVSHLVRGPGRSSRRRQHGSQRAQRLWNFAYVGAAWTRNDE